MCGSDRHVLDGDWKLPLPTVRGHEGAGTVEAIGDGVTDVAVGDHVILSWFYPCRRCTACLSGKSYVCTGSRSEECLLPDGSSPLTLDGERVFPYLTVGSMSEYAVVPEAGAIRIPEEVPFDVASLIGCSVATGGVGLSIIMALRLVGANPIIAVDLSEEKLATARKFGATHTLVPSDGLAEEIAAITGEGAAYAFEAIGRVQTIESLPSLIAAGGKAVIVGLPPEDSPVSIDALALAESGKSLIGSNYGSTVPGRDFPRLAALYLAGRLPVDALISHRIGLDDVNEAFDAMRRGERARSVIVF